VAVKLTVLIGGSWFANTGLGDQTRTQPSSTLRE